MYGVTSKLANSPSLYLKYPAMAIIAALSVVNSKAGTKRFHECSWAISCKLLRSPEFADTPPDTAISEIPKSFAAITNLEVSEFIIAFCIEAA